MNYRKSPKNRHRMMKLSGKFGIQNFKRFVPLLTDDMIIFAVYLFPLINKINHIHKLTSLIIFHIH